MEGMPGASSPVELCGGAGAIMGAAFDWPGEKPIGIRGAAPPSAAAEFVAPPPTSKDAKGGGFEDSTTKAAVTNVSFDGVISGFKDSGATREGAGGGCCWNAEVGSRREGILRGREGSLVLVETPRGKACISVLAVLESNEWEGVVSTPSSSLSVLICDGGCWSDMCQVVEEG
jgi:hypothetical protein